jgi:hypothetical protein
MIRMDKIMDIIKGDILTFKTSDNKYKALLCTSTYKVRSPYYYTFAALTYSSYNKPATSDIIESEFYGIGNTRNDYFKYSDNELQRMWLQHPEIKSYFLGSYGFDIWRKEFTKFQNGFEFVGNIQIVDNLDKNGNGSINANNWEILDKLFVNKMSIFMDERDQTIFKIKAILID